MDTAHAFNCLSALLCPARRRAACPTYLAPRDPCAVTSWRRNYEPGSQIRAVLRHGCGRADAEYDMTPTRPLLDHTHSSSSCAMSSQCSEALSMTICSASRYHAFNIQLEFACTMPDREIPRRSRTRCATQPRRTADNGRPPRRQIASPPRLVCALGSASSAMRQ